MHNQELFSENTQEINKLNKNLEFWRGIGSNYKTKYENMHQVNLNIKTQLELAMSQHNSEQKLQMVQQILDTFL